MNLPNESVIILDSPEIKSMARRRSLKVKRSLKVPRTQSGKRKSVGVKGNRTPLRAVSRSIFRGSNTPSRSDFTPLTIKRKRQRSQGGTPKIQKRRRKSKPSENDDDSVIVLSDDDEIQELPVRPDPPRVIPTSGPPTTKTSHGKNLRNQLRKSQRLRVRKKTKVPTQKLKRRPNDEDLEVLWSSKSVPESAPGVGDERVNSPTESQGNQENVSNPEENFFVDIAGDTSLFLVDCLEDDHEKEKSKRNKKPGEEERLREIIIDGCNVAMAHANSKGFSEQGLKIVLDYFTERGHKVTIFVPQHKRHRNRQMLETWNREGIVVFTPSRKIGQKSITPYDDRYILEYATKCQGIVISSDQFRDLWNEKPEWRETIEKRLLAPTFVGDYLMFPEDPLGRFGPSLHDFLRL
uniref:ZC3H12C_0 protein n=2 Tax=Fopius arisanus TaxID=64838 RepID=A0A0C9PKC2_9HYME